MTITVEKLCTGWYRYEIVSTEGYVVDHDILETKNGRIAQKWAKQILVDYLDKK